MLQYLGAKDAFDMAVMSRGQYRTHMFEQVLSKQARYVC